MKRKHVSRRFRRFVKANEAVSALEYAILVGVIAVAIATALATFGSNITAAINQIRRQGRKPGCGGHRPVVAELASGVLRHYGYFVASGVGGGDSWLSTGQVPR